MNALVELADAFGASTFAPHAMCMAREPLMLALYLISNVVVAISYLVIGGVLVFRRNAGLRAVLAHQASFGAFILSCALTHVMHALTLYVAVYRLEVIVLSLTASISATTALYTFAEALRPDHHRGPPP